MATQVTPSINVEATIPIAAGHRVDLSDVDVSVCSVYMLTTTVLSVPQIPEAAIPEKMTIGDKATAIII